MLQGASKCPQMPRISIDLPKSTRQLLGEEAFREDRSMAKQASRIIQAHFRKPAAPVVAPPPMRVLREPVALQPAEATMEDLAPIPMTVPPML